MTRPGVLALVAIAFVCAAAPGPAMAGPRLRAPTAHERRGIAKSLLQVWNDESRDSRTTRPTLVEVRVLRAHPAYASAVVALRDGRGPWMVVLNASPRSWRVVAGPAVDFPLSCTRVTKAPVRALLCPSPWAVVDHPRPQVEEQRSYDQPLPASDLSQVDWRNVVLPGGTCGSSRPIRAHEQDRYEATALVDGDVNLPWWNTVVVTWRRRAVFGDLDGDGRDEAALDVACANDGGTASGQLRFATVVFKADGARLRALGVVPVQQPLDVRAAHCPVGFITRIGSAGVVMKEGWYGPFDTPAGGSGESVVTWRYQGGRFVRTNTRIVVPVWRSAVDIADVIGRPGDHEIWPTGPAKKVPLTRDLRFDLTFVNQDRRTRRDVRVTVTIDQAAGPIIRRLTIRRLKGWTQKTLHLRHLEAVRPGRSGMTIDIHRPGAHPKRFRVKFTRAKA